jgi:hypothetical protein
MKNTKLPTDSPSTPKKAIEPHEPSWEEIKTLRVAFCVKKLLKQNPKKAFRFIETMALGGFTVTKERGMSMIPRKEFDTWRDAK